MCKTTFADFDVVRPFPIENKRLLPEMFPETLGHIVLKFAAGKVSKDALHVFQHLDVVVFALVCLDDRLVGVAICTILLRRAIHYRL